MIKLRPGQVDVARYRKGYMAVPAVPGAGKTTVLAYLAAELIEKDLIEQGKILIVTYMNSAVSNFRNRIGDYLEQRGLSRNRGYEVRTLHSLALNILKEKPEFLLINDDFQIIDPVYRGKVIRDLINKWLQENPRRTLKFFSYDPAQPGYNRAVKRWREDHFPEFIKKMISHFKLQGLNRDHAYNLQDKLTEDCYLCWALKIYQEYVRLLYQEGLLDFDDLIIQSLKLLKGDDKLRQRLADKYTYVFEDEAQDSNYILAEILRLLAGKEGNLVRVGDSNQSIMGTFTSADPTVFRSYVQSEKVKKNDILLSSRSTEDIIDLANYLVKWTITSHPQPECREALEEKYIKPVTKDDPAPNPVTEGYTIGCHTFSTSEEEMKQITHTAVQQAQKSPDETIAILLPSNYAVDMMAQKFEEYNIPYEKVTNKLNEELEPIRNMRRIFNYLAEPHECNYFITLCQNIFLNEEDDIDLYTGYLNRILDEVSLEKILYPRTENIDLNKILGEDQPQKYLEWLEKACEQIRLWLEASVDLPPDELILFLAEKLGLRDEDLAIAQNMALQIKGELDYNPHWKLHDIADEFSRLQPAFERFARKIYERKGYEPQPGVVTITTMHKAKGLEWDTLFIMYLTNNYYPSSVNDRFRGEYYYLEDDYSNPTALARARLAHLLENDSSDAPQKEARLETIREKLRLLYVGITRAERNLFLSAHREIVYDTNSKKVREAKPYQALKKYIKGGEERDAG